MSEGRFSPRVNTNDADADGKKSSRHESITIIE